MEQRGAVALDVHKGPPQVTVYAMTPYDHGACCHCLPSVSQIRPCKTGQVEMPDGI